MQYTKESTRFEIQRHSDGSIVGSHNFKCAYCGDDSGYYMYCSQRCVNDAAIARRKQKVTARRDKATHCVICGKSIEQDPYRKIKKYCSPACRQRAYRQRQAICAEESAREEA